MRLPPIPSPSGKAISGLFSAANTMRGGGVFQRKEAAPELEEEARRQHPVSDGAIIPVRYAPQVGPRPIEFVALAEDDS